MDKGWWRNQGGFTLMEVMVVLLIMGVLVAIAMPGFSGQVEKARVSRTMAELKSMQTLVELYNLEHSEYPKAEQFKELMAENGLGDIKDPWDREYSYTLNGKGYIILSHGPSGEGDAADNIYITNNTREPKQGSPGGDD
ncbi:type IV pilin protein [Desulfofalx alkaliphila]|uniref:type IV pilin protein n=1 Tax=Desulfofalx alkaliphila TaxID=105483 RepID=UPI000555B3AB|nr:prepilin-type N-terminal cleavage/methylation domain-containing protein [Desulfofalx alkaliphila]